MAEEDILFGKKRHLFGGMEPSNMRKFEGAINNSNNIITLDVEIPSDTVIDGQTLCTVEGAIIRKRIDDYPKDEFDGTFIADVKDSIAVKVSDTDVIAGGTYYYAAFPYTTQGVYNRNKANRIAINEPGDMKTFSFIVRNIDGVPEIVITAELSDNVAGAVIRKSITGYPSNENDGELVADISENSELVDSDIQYGVTYYYAAFPYTATGAYNRSSKNRFNKTLYAYTYYYGYDLDTTDSNSTSRVTYPSDVDNADYKAVSMNYTDDVFDYGDWPSEAGEKFMPRPCQVNYNNNNSIKYLDPLDYTKDLDGVSADITKVSNGDIMMEWSKIWTKRWEDEDGVYHFRCSDQQLDDEYECWCNYDKNDNQIDHFYTAVYSGLNSISGVTRSDTTNTLECVDDATNKGDGWYPQLISDYLLIQDLLVMMAKTTDTQKAYGNGRSQSGDSSNKSFIKNGTMNAKGLFWGSNYWTEGVKVFGMENLWGNGCRWLRFLVFKKLSTNTGRWRAKFTLGTKDGSSIIGFSGNGESPDSYIEIPVTITVPGSNTYSNILSCYTTPFGRIPISCGSASSNQYECDAMNFSYSSSLPSNLYVTVGGGTINGGGNGIFGFYMCAGGSTGKDNIGSISYKPTLVVEEG